MLGDPIHTLLVTPDEKWRAELGRCLAQNAFEPVGQAGDATTALALLHQTRPDLVVIEAQLPDADGLILCQLVQTMYPQVKIVLATKDEAALQMAALETNVAGCVNRDLPPAHLASLLTYVNSGGALFSSRMIEEFLTRDWRAKSQATIVTIGPLHINVASRQVTVAGQRVFLTPREFALLVCLVRNIGQVVTFDQLLNEAWGYDAEMGTSAQVRLYITRLRRKLVDNPVSPSFIVTERGVGYRLRSSAQWHRRAKTLERRLVAASGFVLLPLNPQLAANKIKKVKNEIAHHFESFHNSIDDCWQSVQHTYHHLERELITHSQEFAGATHEWYSVAISDFAPLLATLI